jgi:hypothetical protein
MLHHSSRAGEVAIAVITILGDRRRGRDGAACHDH